MKEDANVLYDVYLNEMAGKQPAQPMWRDLTENQKDTWRAIVTKFRAIQG